MHGPGIHMTSFVDNKIVCDCWANGKSRDPILGRILARVWHEIRTHRCTLRVVYVGTKDQLADEPSRTYEGKNANVKATKPPNAQRGRYRPQTDPMPGSGFEWEWDWGDLEDEEEKWEDEEGEGKYKVCVREVRARCVRGMRTRPKALVVRGRHSGSSSTAAAANSLEWRAAARARYRSCNGILGKYASRRGAEHWCSAS